MTFKTFHGGYIPILSGRRVGSGCNQNRMRAPFEKMEETDITIFELHLEKEG